MSKIPFIENLKRPACASKREVLEFVTLRYLEAFFSLGKKVSGVFFSDSNKQPVLRLFGSVFG